MPLLKNAKKALRVSQRRQAINRRVRTRVKTFSDKVRQTMNEADLGAAYSAIDKSVKKKLMHKNKAARLKSQLAKIIKKTPTKKPQAK